MHRAASRPQSNFGHKLLVRIATTGRYVGMVPRCLSGRRFGRFVRLSYLQVPHAFSPGVKVARGHRPGPLHPCPYVEFPSAVSGTETFPYYLQFSPSVGFPVRGFVVGGRVRVRATQPAFGSGGRHVSGVSGGGVRVLHRFPGISRNSVRYLPTVCSVASVPLRVSVCPQIAARKTPLFFIAPVGSRGFSGSKQGNDYCRTLVARDDAPRPEQRQFFPSSRSGTFRYRFSQRRLSTGYQSFCSDAPSPLRGRALVFSRSGSASPSVFGSRRG